MAIVNSIGSFDFLTLDGQPEGIKDDVETTWRPGIDGLAFWIRGRRGQPFILRSKVDMQSKLSARVTYTNYCNAIGTQVSLAWSGLQLAGLEATDVFILDVKLVELCRLPGPSSGGINPPSLGWIECDWTLVTVTF